MERADAPAVSLLCGELGYPVGDSDTAARIDALSGSDRDLALVADHQGEVVGWIHVVVRAFLESEPCAELAGLVVTARRRSEGIGAALADGAEAWVRAQGLTRIRVRSNIVRADAHRFYQRRGYRVVKTQQVLDKQL